MKANKYKLFIESSSLSSLSFGAISSVIVGLISFFNYIFFQNNIISLIISIFTGTFFFIIGIKMFSNWDFSLNIPKRLSIIMLILAIISILNVIYITTDLQHSAKKEWDNACIDKNLPLKCTPFDLCKSDCIQLNKKYYRYEGGGLFNDDNCWCINKDTTEQIW